MRRISLTDVRDKARRGDARLASVDMSASPAMAGRSVSQADASHDRSAILRRPASDQRSSERAGSDHGPTIALGPLREVERGRAGSTLRDGNLQSAGQAGVQVACTDAGSSNGMMRAAQGAC